jgi:hypothetical protein
MALRESALQFSLGRLIHLLPLLGAGMPRPQEKLV